MAHAERLGARGARISRNLPAHRKDGTALEERQSELAHHALPGPCARLVATRASQHGMGRALWRGLRSGDALPQDEREAAEAAPKTLCRDACVDRARQRNVWRSAEARSEQEPAT